MAKNAPWRGSVATWRERDRPTGSRAPARRICSSVDIFFDLRGGAWRRRALPTRCGAAFEAAAGAGRVRQASGRGGRHRRARPRACSAGSAPKADGSISRRPVCSARRGGARDGDPPPCAGAIDTGAARWREGASFRSAETDLDALGRGRKAVFLDLILSQQIEDIAQGNTAYQRRLRSSGCRPATAIDCVRRLKRSTAIDELTRDLLFED